MPRTIIAVIAAVVQTVVSPKSSRFLSRTVFQSFFRPPCPLFTPSARCPDTTRLGNRLYFMDTRNCAKRRDRRRTDVSTLSSHFRRGVGVLKRQSVVWVLFLANADTAQQEAVVLGRRLLIEVVAVGRPRHTYAYIIVSSTSAES